jgi:hypothetical protein
MASFEDDYRNELFDELLTQFELEEERMEALYPRELVEPPPTTTVDDDLPF